MWGEDVEERKREMGEKETMRERKSEKEKGGEGEKGEGGEEESVRQRGGESTVLLE